MTIETAWPELAGAVVGLLFLVAAGYCGRRRRLVQDTPTSKCQGVFIGLVEVKGTAESEAPLRGYLSGTVCVLYSWEVQEHWSRTVTETYRDSKGNTRTRTRHESGWKTVASGGEQLPFYLQDDTGVVLIRPEGATLEPITVFDHTCGPGDPLYYGKGPGGAVANSDHRRRFTEKAVPLHAPLYIIGQSRLREDVVAAEIAASPNAGMFLISTRSEEQVSASYGRFYWLWVVLGMAAAVGGVALMGHLAGLTPPSLVPHFTVAVSGFLAVWGFAWLWMVYNSLIGLRQRVRQAWAQVDIQLKRRTDLIPRLVETVKGIRGHEQVVQEMLAALRAQLDATPQGKLGPDYTGCTGAVQSVVEQYPDLTANVNFADLQKNLIDTEQRIALARAYFNDIATFYNIRLERVPDRWVAAIAAMKAAPLMTAGEFERAPVQVSFAAAP